MGDRGSFIYTDNLNKSIEYTGEILVDLIPKIYDTERVVRILNIDGTSEQITLNEGISETTLSKFNQTITDEQTGEKEIVNDLSRGKYDVVVDTGPAFATQRMESAQQLIDLTANSPIFAELANDLIAKNLDILEGEELSKRIRARMIDQGIVKPTEEEIKELGLDQPQQPDPSNEALIENIQMQSLDLQSKIEERDAKIAKLMADTNTQQIDAMQKMLDNFAKQQEVGIPLSQQDHNMRIKQQDIIEESQQEIDQGPNSEQAQDIIAQAQQQIPQQ